MPIQPLPTTVKKTNRLKGRLKRAIKMVQKHDKQCRLVIGHALITAAKQDPKFAGLMKELISNLKNVDQEYFKKFAYAVSEEPSALASSKSNESPNMGSEPLTPPTHNKISLAEAPLLFSNDNTETIAALTAPLTRNPYRADYGFRAVIKRAAHAGGDAKAYFWFKDEATLRDFLAIHATNLIAANLTEADKSKLANKIAKLFKKESAVLHINVIVAYLVVVIGDYITFEWTGSFDELISGRSLAAAEIRYEFREDQNKRHRTSKSTDGFIPVKQRELADFRRYLAEPR